MRSSSFSCKALQISENHQCGSWDEAEFQNEFGARMWKLVRLNPEHINVQLEWRKYICFSARKLVWGLDLVA